MDSLIIIIVILVIVYYFAKRSRKQNISVKLDKPQKRKTSGSVTARQTDDFDWLETRWQLAETQQQSGKKGIFPHWYYDDATERQLEKLEEHDVKVKRKILTKGQASDLIGIREPPEEEQLEILRFFKVKTKGMNQTKARHEVALLLNDKEKVKEWNSRKPSQIQKEYFKFFGIKMENGLTITEASKIISRHKTELAEKEDPKLDEWEAFEEIIDELFDPDLREDCEIKKPSMSLICKALDEIKQEGKLYREAADDIDIVINKLIQIKPDLQRNQKNV